MALAPCLLGYGVIAAQLFSSPLSKRGLDQNPYWTWIENYVADDYVQAVKTGSELFERHALRQSPERIEELVKIFVHATKVRCVPFSSLSLSFFSFLFPLFLLLPLCLSLAGLYIYISITLGRSL